MYPLLYFKIVDLHNPIIFLADGTVPFFEVNLPFCSLPFELYHGFVNIVMYIRFIYRY